MSKQSDSQSSPETEELHADFGSEVQAAVSFHRELSPKAPTSRPRPPDTPGDSVAPTLAKPQNARAGAEARVDAWVSQAPRELDKVAMDHIVQISPSVAHSGRKLNTDTTGEQLFVNSVLEQLYTVKTDSDWDIIQAQERWQADRRLAGKRRTIKSAESIVSQPPAASAQPTERSPFSTGKIRTTSDAGWSISANDDVPVLSTEYENDGGLSGCAGKLGGESKSMNPGKGKGRLRTSNESVGQFSTEQFMGFGTSTPHEDTAGRWGRMNQLSSWQSVDQLLGQRDQLTGLVTERPCLRTCAVCGDVKTTLDFPAKAPTSTCQHPPQTCTGCLRTWIASELDTKGTDRICCPECPAILQHEDVRRAASTATFEAYDRICARHALSGLPEFAWCLHPECESGQLNASDQNFMHCASCGYRQCLRHQVP